MSTLRSLCLLGLAAALFATAPLPAQELSKEEKDAGFVLLFNGKDLSQWKQEPQGDKAIWRVEDDGVLFCRKVETERAKGHNPLFTKRGDYKDFILRFDFCLSEGCNNGLGFRMPKEAYPENNLSAGWYFYKLGLEIQILDDATALMPDFKSRTRGFIVGQDDGDFGPGDPELYLHGSLCGISPVKKDHGKLKGADQWNSQEVIVKGRRLQVILNGEGILDVDFDKLKKAPAGLKRTEGHICFVAQRGRLELKNIRIKELK